MFINDAQILFYFCYQLNRRMSNTYATKSTMKPLKGGITIAGEGIFETITATTIKLEQITIAGLFEDGLLDNVVIRNSIIENTIIGKDNTHEDAFFKELTVYDKVTFNSYLLDKNVVWDPVLGEFVITGTFKVDGCSRLGNIEICNNDIKAVNTNGDINIQANRFGSIFLNNQIFNISTFGSFYSELPNGGATFNVGNNILLSSSFGSIALSSNDNQTFRTVNGNMVFNVDQGIGSRVITNISNTLGNVVITTSGRHELKSGDIVTLSNTNSIPQVNSTYTVGNILSSTRFTLTTPITLSSIGTVGNLIKLPNNNIVLNTLSQVQIPADTRLTFGEPTCNYITGNTSNMSINSCGDILLNVPSDKIVQIPEQTKLQIGTSGNNYINHSGPTLNIISDNTLFFNSALARFDSTNVILRDPILKLADYTLTSNDGKDRGVEFNYFDSTTGTTKLGWFGYKNSTQRFTFIVNATNNNEIISGDVGSLELDRLVIGNINLVDNGTINANCGSILNLRQITGCGNVLNIQANSNINITSANINLNATQQVFIPNNIPIAFGTSGTTIREASSGNLVAQSNSIILSSGNVVIPTNSYISFNGSSTGLQRISANTSGQLLIQSSNDIFLSTTGGNVIIPTGTDIQFGSSGTRYIDGNSSGTNIGVSTGNINMNVNVGDINLFPTLGNVRIPQSINLVFSANGTTNSLQLGTNSNLNLTGNSSNSFVVNNFQNINLNASDFVSVPDNVKLYFGTSGTNTIFTNTSGQLIVTSQTSTITSATLNISNNTTNITSNNVIINGQSTQIDSANTLFSDPILTISNYTTGSSDGKDKGVEYKYFNTTSALGTMALGWFGSKTDTGRFTYYSNAVNTGEVITGTIGDMQINSLFLNSQVILPSSGSLEMNCAPLNRVGSITGCGDTLNLNGNQIINLNASNRVNMPFNVPLVFGNTQNNFFCDTAGNIFVNSASKIVFNSDVQINGTQTTIYSTITNLQDPIFSLGGVTGPLVNDSKDRGIEFKWNNGSSSKTGFFGYKDSLQRFVFIQDGINVNEVFSGSFGNVQFGDGGFTNLNLQNGNITGINVLSGGQVTILTTSGNINLTPTRGSNVVLPFDTRVAFGNTSNSITSNSNGNMVMSSSNQLTVNPNNQLILQSNNSSVDIRTSTNVRVPDNVPFYFGSSNNTYFLQTSGNFIVQNSSGNIDLTPMYSTGTVNIPANNYLAFGSTSNSIYSDNNKLILNGYNGGIDLNSTTVTISGNINILGNLSSTSSDFDRYILPLGTSQILDITSIVNTVGGLLITTSAIHNFRVGDTISLVNTNSVPKVDGTFQVQNVISPTVFNIPGSIVSNGSTGLVKSNLMTSQQGKDVGIQINYWSTTGNPGITSGSPGYKTGFMGFETEVERFRIFSNATISNNNVTQGVLGDMETNKLFTSRISGFQLDGGISGGSNLISGTNFSISGGSINNTPIGQSVASPGRFTTLANTGQASIFNLRIENQLALRFERYILSSTGVTTRSPNIDPTISMFSVLGPNYTTSAGYMPTAGVPDGTYKILVCSAMDTGCIHTIYFTAGTLITPNPMNSVTEPTQLVFKRRSQSAQLIFDIVQNAWILLSSGCYVY